MKPRPSTTSIKQSSHQYLCHQSLFHRPQYGVRVERPSWGSTDMFAPLCMDLHTLYVQRRQLPSINQYSHTMVLHKHSQVPRIILERMNNHRNMKENILQDCTMIKCIIIDNKFRVINIKTRKKIHYRILQQYSAQLKRYFVQNY